MGRLAQSRIAVVAALSLLACHSDSTLSLRVTPSEVEQAPFTEIQFKAQIGGSLNQRVTWSIETLGALANEDAGSIDPETGLYTAPARIPRAALNHIVVRARSHKNPDLFSDALVRIIPAPLDPAFGPSVGKTTVRIDRKRFSPGSDPGLPSEVLFDGVAASFEAESPYTLTASSPAHAIGAVDVTIRYLDGIEEHYPLAYRYGASHLHLSGSQTVSTCDEGVYRVEATNIDGCGTTEIIALCGGGRIQVIDASLGVNPTLVREFQPTQTWQTRNFELADVNHDDFDDLVVIGNQTVSLFVNRGNSAGCGTWRGFAPEETLLDVSAQQWTPIWLALGDFDGDDNKDVAISNFYNARIFRGDGLGGFVPNAALSVNDHMGMAVGDFDGDGRDDLAFALRYVAYGGVEVHFARGLDPLSNIVTFTRHREVTLHSFCQGVPDSSIASGDRLGLGHDQIVIGMSFTGCSGMDALLLSWNATTRAFDTDTYAFMGASGGPTQVHTGDFNSDDLVDVAFIGYGSVEVHWGSRDPWAYYRDNITAYLTGTAHSYIDYRFADTSGDGLPELITYGFDVPITIANGLPSDHYLAFGATRTSLESGSLYVTSTVRLDVMGKPLLASAIEPMTQGSQAAIALVDVATRAIVTTQTLPVEADDNIWTPYLAAGDLNEDGWKDLVAASTVSTGTAERTQLWLALGSDQGIAPFEPLNTPLPGSRIQDLSLGDLNGDGHLDLALATLGYGETAPTPVVVILGSGAQLSWSVLSLGEAGIQGFHAQLHDLDLDGRCELISAEGIETSKLLRIYRYEDAANAAEITSEDIATLALADIVISDLDGDSFPDIVSSGVFAMRGLSVLHNRNGVIDTPDNYPLATEENGPANLATVDVTSDGVPDIVATTHTGALMLFEGLGAARFKEPIGFYTGAYAGVIHGQDFSGDGLADLIIADQAGTLRWVENLSW